MLAASEATFGWVEGAMAETDWSGCAPRTDAAAARVGVGR
jgi:hypothetical protein